MAAAAKRIPLDKPLDTQTQKNLEMQWFGGKKVNKVGQNYKSPEHSDIDG